MNDELAVAEEDSGEGNGGDAVLAESAGGAIAVPAAETNGSHIAERTGEDDGVQLSAASKPTPAGSERAEPGGTAAAEPVSAETAREANAPTDGDRSARAGSLAKKRPSDAGGVRKSISDFFVGMLLGEGAYARVHVCKLKSSKEQYAVKVMEKRFIVKEGKINFVNMEKKVLSMVDHPLVARLYFSFHDQRYLYMVIDLCKGGELQKLISFRTDEQLTQRGVVNRACSTAEAQFYLAETISAVQYLHSLGFIHRDLKPDNVLLSADGHIKLTDFGTVKDERSDPSTDTSGKAVGNARRGTFCGTAEFVSPEVLQDAEPSVGADLWALGCMLYQLLVGTPPFRAGSEYFTFQLIMNHGAQQGVVAIPPMQRTAGAIAADVAPATSDSAEEATQLLVAQDLINCLLKPDPAQRLGASNNCTTFSPSYDPDTGNGPEALRQHPFFTGVDFDRLPERQAPALPYHYSIPEPEYDGASDQWMLAGDITELELAAALEMAAPSAVLAAEVSNGLRSAMESPDGAPTSSPSLAAAAAQGVDGSATGIVQLAPPPLAGPGPNDAAKGELAQFLRAGEKIVLDGLVVKRKGIFHTNTRHLMLTDLPRFIYIDPIKVVLKGEIPIHASVKISVKNNRTFDIVTPKRTYHMTDLMSHAQRWASAFAEVTGARSP